MRFLIVFLLMGGCKTANPVVSEPEFMTYLQDNPHFWSAGEHMGVDITERMLVKKVHEKAWDIDYGFAPNCSRRERKKLEPKVVEAIRRAVNLWLHPVRTIQQKFIKEGKFPSELPPKLVNQLNIHEKKKLFPLRKGQQKLYATFNFGNIWHKLLEKDPKGVELLLNLPELSVVFNCNEGRPWLQQRFNSINIYEETKNTKRNIPETKFSFGALLHEVGHAFGLADTYVDAKNSFRDHMISTDVNPYTIGHQPISVMSIYQLLYVAHYDDVKPTVDDQHGIYWLYIHMHMNKLKLDTCPRHYQPEFFARDEQDKAPSIACRPQYPFLFAMASENYSTARLLFNNKAPIDINARIHKRGSTALHYAVALAPIQFLVDILERFHKEIDFSITGSIFTLPPMTVMVLAKTLLKIAQKENEKEMVEIYTAVVKILSKYTD